MLEGMQVAIVAGGLATRLGGLTRGQPKSLVRILGKPFLEYQIEFLRRGGVRDIVLCTGHLGEQIESYFGNGMRFGVDIRYSREPKLLGTAGALKNAQSLLADTFFTLYGDSYVFIDFRAAMSHFVARGEPALMTVYKNDDLYDRSNTAVADGLVTKYSKRERTADMVYIDYGVNLFRKAVLDMVPRDEPYSLEALHQRLIEGRQLGALEITERFYEIGSVQGLREFEEYVRRAL